MDDNTCGGWGYYTQFTDNYTTESMSYNVSGQMTSLGWSGGSVSGGITYTYSTTQNNGQVTGVTDSVSGEAVAYQYDALKRLTSASATPTTGSTPAAWTQSFSYDGFGNLTGKTLNGTVTSIPVNAGTNQLLSASYDANGNMTSGAGVSLGYDEANRVVSATPTSGGTEYYGYAPDNKRVYRLTPQTGGGWVENWTFYGAQGEKLVTNMQLAGPNEVFTGGVQTGWSYSFTGGQSAIWFAGKMIYDGGAMYQDRLGTNRSGGARFRPYGDEITSTGNDRVKFGTYTRDSLSGLDYADQRFYTSSYGRFNTPDPYQAAAKGANDPSTPMSWNRYTYVDGDPVNWYDPKGLFLEAPPKDCPPGMIYYNGRCVVAVNDDTEKGMPNGGGGGGGGGSTLAALYTVLNSAVNRAEDDLINPQCASLWGTNGPDPALALQQISNSGNIKIYNFGYDFTSADPGPSPGVGAQTAGGTIQVASNRYFFTGIEANGQSVSSDPNSVFFGLTQAQVQETILIHELLHATGIVGSDSAGQKITLGNGEVVTGSAGVTAAVRQNCLQ